MTLNILISFQILGSLDIVIPMHQILKMFKSGVLNIDPNNSEPLMQSEGHGHIPGSPAAPLSPERFPFVSDPFVLYDKESELVLPCFVMMLDLTLKQVGPYLASDPPDNCHLNVKKWPKT